MSPTFRLLDLPEELARLIFELVAEERTAAAWVCALVSRRVQSWVEPVLYRRTQIHSSRQQGRIVQTIQHHPAKPPDFFAVHVKDLGLTHWNWGYSTNIVQTATIVEACTGVRKLAIRIQSVDPSDEENIGRLSKLLGSSESPQIRVTVPLTFFPTAGGSLTHPLFQNVSHLEIEWVTAPRGDRWAPPSQWDWSPLCRLQRLAHICVHLNRWGEYQAAARHIATAPSHFPSWLQVFMVFVRWPPGDMSRMEENTLSSTGSDVRVVVCTHERTWQDHAAGSWLKRNTVPRVPGNNALNQDFWEKAEILVEKRRKGLVEWPPNQSPTSIAL